MYFVFVEQCFNFVQIAVHFSCYNGSILFPMDGNARSLSWKRQFPLIETPVSLYGNWRFSIWEPTFLYMGTDVSSHTLHFYDGLSGREEGMEKKNSPPVFCWKKGGEER